MIPVNNIEETSQKIWDEFKVRYPSLDDSEYKSQCLAISDCAASLVDAEGLGEGPYIVACGGSKGNLFITVRTKEVK